MSPTVRHPARSLILAAALVGAPFGGQGDAADFDEWLASYAGKGEEVRTHDAGVFAVREIKAAPTSARPGLVLVWAEFRTSLALLQVEEVREYGHTDEIYTKRVPRDALAAVNGGFFGYDKARKHIPLGLVIANRRIANPRIGWITGGILQQADDGAIAITPVKSFRSSPSIVNALQSKPLLVEKGSVAIRADDDRFNRSAFCLTPSGAVVLAGAFESFGRAVTLKEFAAFLVKLRELGGPEIESALAMDGGPGARLWFPSLALHYGDPGDNYVPNLIYLKRSPGERR
jgi:phosphodiester glycosidase